MDRFKQEVDNALDRYIRGDLSTTVFKTMLKVIFAEIGTIEYLKSMLTTDTNFHNALISLRDAYADCKQRTPLSTNVNYALSINRSAYLYAYGTSHANMIRNEWEYYATYITTPLLLNSVLRLCCVGGGPATDAIGLRLFLGNRLFVPDNLEVTVLDKWTDWECTASKLIEKFNALIPRCKVSTLKYERFDFLEDAPNNFQSLRLANIVTMVKFLSVVCQDEHQCRIKLREIMDAMKQHAVLLFVENAGGPYNDVFKSVATEAGFQQLAERPKHRVRITSGDEELINKARLAGNNRHQPQKTAKVVSSLYMKPDAWELPAAA